MLLMAALFAQSKVFTLEDIFRNRDLYPESYSGLQWIGNSPAYSFQEANALMKGSLDKEDEQILVSLEKLNTAIKAVGGSSQKRFPFVTWADSDRFSFLADQVMYEYVLSTGKARKLAICEKEAQNHDMAPLTAYVAYTRDNNLFVAMGEKQVQLSFEPDTGVITGQIVHRNEWGIEKGTFWSPDGKALAFYRMDESMVTNYPLVDISQVPAVVENTRYPMAGMNSHVVSIGIYNTANSSLVFLNTGAPGEEFLTNITWTPDSKYILVAVLNRAQDHMWLKMYDASNGKYLRTLFEETDPQYVEPLHGPVFLKKNPAQFIWQSPRDGYNHLYLYDLNGQLIKQLTSGNWMVTQFHGISADDKKAWFSATKESPVCRDLYNIEIPSGKIKRLTEGAGWHDVILSDDLSHFIDDFSSLSIASLYSAYSSEGKKLKELVRDENPLKDYKLGKTRIFTLKSDLGDDLYCRLITPADFDSTRRYPVLVYVYGGPHNQLITNTWLGGAGLFLNYLANQGYIVFGMDNHGTAGRGQEFEQVIHRQVGVQEVKDQMTGVNYLKSLPYVDRNRIGVHGWSYGGFMTISMLVQHPEAFEVGVAGGPVCDWKYYEVMYGERYMDTPAENAAGYDRSALTNRVDLLKARLLIIHGTMDPTVVQQNSLDFIQQCVKKGVLVDYSVYPGHEHNVGGIDRLHLYRAIEQYIREHL